MEETQKNMIPEDQQSNSDPELIDSESENPVIIPSSHRVRFLRRNRKKGFISTGLMFLYGIITGLAAASVIWYSLNLGSQKQIETIEIERTADAMVQSAEIGALQKTISDFEVLAAAKENNLATLQAGWDTSQENLAILAALITPSATLVPTRTVSPTPTPLLLRTVIPTLTISGSDENESIPVQQLPVTDSMVLIPDGNFMMGSDTANAHTDEKPIHEVRLKKYWIDKVPVTNGDYQRCVEAGNCSDPAAKSSQTRPDYYGNSIYANYPVVNVDWNQAVTYCKWLGKRLPTEAEWEKAAKGDDNRTYPWGEIAPDEYRLNFDHQIGDTVEVGKYLAGKSPYGVLDLAGNVWEWISDWYGEAYYQNLGEALVSNPQGPSEGSYRVLRGGSFGSNAWYVRVSARSGNAEKSVSNSRGFRCAYAEDE
ncbi:MAG: formylglycine-generating enzyme family protein [Flexilinea sp.]